MIAPRIPRLRIRGSGMPLRRIAVLLSRMLLVASVPVLLAGCVTNEMQVTEAAQAQPPAEPAQAAPAAQQYQTQPAARSQRGVAIPVAAPQEPDANKPMTVTRARELCWMDQEGKVKRDIDTRLKLVEKCVERRMSGQMTN